MDTSHNAKPQKNEIPIFWIFAAFIITISNDAYAQSCDQQVRTKIDSAFKVSTIKLPTTQTMLFDRMNTKHLISMIFNERAAAIYNFSPRYFARSAIMVRTLSS